MSGYTTTPNLGLKKPIPGEDVDLWGDHWNQNADVLDAALGALGLNVRGFGAVGDGVTMDTAAIQAALAAVPATGGTVHIPRGYTFLFNAPLPMKANTTITGGGTLKAAAKAAWGAATNFHGLTNVNLSATSVTDTNLNVFDITMDYSLFPAGAGNGTDHTIRFGAVAGVRIERVTTIGGASSVALTHCVDVQEIGNRYLNFYNCGSDHWDRSANVRVIGCHLETAVSAQMLNFNPDGTSVTNTGDTSDGLTVTGCTFNSTENPSTPCQIEPLRAGGIVKNVTITGNTFKGTWLVLRGDVWGASITGNTFSDFVGNNCVVQAHDALGGTPKYIDFIGNIIRDPLTGSGNISVIRLESLTSTIAFNRVSGTAYTAATQTIRTLIGQRLGNQSDISIGANGLQTGLILPNGTANSYGLSDAGGSVVSLFVQADNLMQFQGTTAAGNTRAIFGMQMRSDTSEFTTYRDTLHQGAHRWAPADAVAAFGTTISVATTITTNYAQVTSCVAGVSDGVQLTPSTGRPQTITNATAAILKVYPHNSGTAQIDAGGNSVPTTIAPGKSKTFMLFSTGNYRTIGAF